MYRRGQVCRAANQRYLEALASITGSSSLLQEAAEVCHPVTRNGKRYRALNALAQKVTLYSWRSAAANSPLLLSVTLSYGLFSIQLKQPKPTSLKSDAGARPLPANLRYCELMDFCANSPVLIVISLLPRADQLSPRYSPPAMLMSSNSPKLLHENPRETARSSTSAVQRSRKWAKSQANLRPTLRCPFPKLRRSLNSSPKKVTKAIEASWQQNRI